MDKIISTDRLKSRREIQASVPLETIQGAENDLIQKYRKASKVKGFRPGKAPLEVVRKQFGSEIREEARDTVIREAVIREVKDRGLSPVAPIAITNVEESGDSVVVTAEVEVIPDFEIPDPSGIQVERPVRKVLENDVETQIESLRRQMAEYVPVDRPADEGDYVFVEYTEKEKDGTVVKTVENAYVPLVWGETDPKLHEALRGKETGYVAVVNRKLELEGGEELPRTFEYRIHSVKEEKLPETDEKFAQIFGQADMDSLRGKIRDELMERNRREAENQVEWAIVKAIHDRVQFEVPPSMVVRQAEFLKKSLDLREVKSVESVDDQIQKMAEDMVKREIILERVAERESVKVEDTEIQAEIERRAQAYNMNAEAYRKELEKRGGLDPITEVIRKRKAMDQLKSLVKMEVIIQ
jgi:trigger factor